MGLSIYVHIPYCLQRCCYCDFITFALSDMVSPSRYIEWVQKEIRQRRHWWSHHDEIQTLYFGGGTPSLIAPELIVTVCRELANAGLHFQPNAEVTIEINPATMETAKLEAYLQQESIASVWAHRPLMISASRSAGVNTTQPTPATHCTCCKNVA